MTSRPAHTRSGITLTEVLISILIMGVGLISVATLFPIGLVRLRQAQQQSRSGLLAESAAADMGSKNLLYKPSFLQLTIFYGGLDPFLAESGVGAINMVSATTLTPSASFTGSGLPFCYDPLWYSITGSTPLAGLGRFGAGVIGGNSFLRADPDGNGPPSAYGLQRLTNFVPFGLTGFANWPYQFVVGNQGVGYPYTMRDLAADTFVSPEDTVMQSNLTDQQILNNPNTTGTAGSVVPMMTQVSMSINGGTPLVPGTQADWRYTWMFTGRQHDYTNGTIFAGDIVVMDSRPIGIDTVNSPITNNPSPVASGEIVLEAIFGHGSSFTPSPVGYAVAADRVVLLRWSSAMPDPEIKAGSWIADVTYERNQGTSDTRAANAAAMAALGTAPLYPMQRCHWYQVARKGDVQASSIAGFREMVVYTATPLRSRTLLHNSPATPVYLNAALFMPSVVNVYSRTVYVR